MAANARAWTTRLPGRRSTFQEIIFRWETLHPYNIVCIIDIDSPIELERTRAAVLETLDEMGLGKVVWGSRRRYWCTPADDVPVRMVDDLERQAALELNMPFDDDVPVRLFVTKRDFAESATHVTSFGICCRHLFFDGMSGSIFLRRMLVRAVGAEPTPLVIGRQRQPWDWVRHFGVWLLPVLIANSLWDVIRMSRVYARTADDSPNVDLRFLDCDLDLLTRIRREADAPGVTVNDVLAARLVRGLRAVDDRSRCGSRRLTALSVAVSLRNGIAPLDAGISVGAFPVFVHPSDEPLREIRRQTDRTKRYRTYYRSLLGMALAVMTWGRKTPASSAKRGATLYVPSAGLTNVRIPSVAGDEFVCRLRAAVSTGPILPLMLVAVTHGDRLQLSVIWRKERFAKSEIDVLVRELMA